MIQPFQKQTVARILNAAEESFSLFGYHGASIREVTKKAKVNLAAINYHFKDKPSLYCEVIASRLRPINQSRLKKLTNAGELAGNHPIPLPLILDIFARPFFELCENSNGNGIHLVRLIGRSMSEPMPFVEALLAAELHPVTTRFAQSIRRHVPNLSAEEFMWRLNFVVGAMHHTLATMHRMKDLTKGLCRDNDPAEAMRHFSQFAVSTLTSPPAAYPTSSPGSK